MEMTYNYKAEFECNLCNTFFRTRKDLNIHSKEIHNKNIQPCRNFTSKNCEFDSVVMSSAAKHTFYIISRVTMDRKLANGFKKINAALVIGVFSNTSIHMHKMWLGVYKVWEHPKVSVYLQLHMSHHHRIFSQFPPPGTGWWEHRTN